MGWLNRPQAHIEAPAAPIDQSNTICGQCHGLFAHLQSRERDLNGDPYKVGKPDTDQRVFLRLKPSVLDGRLPVLGQRAGVGGGYGVVRLGARDVRVVGLAPDGIYLAGDDWLTGRRVLSIESSEIEGRLQSFKGGAFLAVTEWPANGWRSRWAHLGMVVLPSKPMTGMRSGTMAPCVQQAVRSMVWSIPRVRVKVV